MPVSVSAAAIYAARRADADVAADAMYAAPCRDAAGVYIYAHFIT